MQQYLDLLRHVRANGRFKMDRTGTGCYSVFGYQNRYNLNDGFPLVTTKKLYLRAIIHELLWFLQGDTNNETLRLLDVRIWNEWAQAEDVTVDVPYTDYERAQLFAKSLDKTQREIEDHLMQLYRSSIGPEGPYSGEGALAHGHQVMDAAEIPRTYKKVTKPKGDLGPIYGKQWRSWEGADGRVHDQITNAIELLRKDPASRRNVVSAWNVGELDKMHLNPCHALFQFYAEELTLQERVNLYKDKQYPQGLSPAQYDADNLLPMAALVERGETAQFDQMSIDNAKEFIESFLKAHEIPKHRLSCELYQRSADSFLGVPFNIASYALLTHMVAQVVGMAVGDFVHTFGDLHIYQNHLEQVDLQLTRDPMPLPKLLLNPEIKNIFDFTIDDIKIVGYESHPAIKGDVAV